MKANAFRSATLLALSALVGCTAQVTTEADEESHTQGQAERLVSGADGHFEDIGLHCTMSWPEVGEGVMVQFENNGDEPVEILKWGTPWDSFARAFTVESDGESVAYAGAIGVRGRPTKASWLTIAPGETSTITYDLAEQHRIQEAGVYTASLSGDLVNIRVLDIALAFQHNCGQVTANLSESEAVARAGVTAQPLIYPSGHGCSNSRRAQLETMEALARTGNTLALGYVESGNPVYAEWFGSWTSNRGDKVADVLEDIESDWPTFTGDCDKGKCGDPDPPNAWVTTGDRIHICSGFFNNPSLSIEAWSNHLGILIHEKSHLVSGDSDQSDSVCPDDGDTMCYGASDARALASDDPGKATRNGENYEKFVSQVYLAAVVTPSVL